MQKITKRVIAFVTMLTLVFGSFILAPSIELYADEIAPLTASTTGDVTFPITVTVTVVTDIQLMGPSHPDYIPGESVQHAEYGIHGDPINGFFAFMTASDSVDVTILGEPEPFDYADITLTTAHDYPAGNQRLMVEPYEDDIDGHYQVFHVRSNYSDASQIRWPPEWIIDETLIENAGLSSEPCLVYDMNIIEGLTANREFTLTHYRASDKTVTITYTLAGQIIPVAGANGSLVITGDSIDSITIPPALTEPIWVIAGGDYVVNAIPAGGFRIPLAFDVAGWDQVGNVFTMTNITSAIHNINVQFETAPDIQSIAIIGLEQPTMGVDRPDHTDPDLTTDLPAEVNITSLTWHRIEAAANIGDTFGYGYVYAATIVMNRTTLRFFNEDITAADIAIPADINGTVVSADVTNITAPGGATLTVVIHFPMIGGAGGGNGACPPDTCCCPAGNPASNCQCNINLGYPTPDWDIEISDDYLFGPGVSRGRRITVQGPTSGVLTLQFLLPGAVNFVLLFDYIPGVPIEVWFHNNVTQINAWIGPIPPQEIVGAASGAGGGQMIDGNWVANPVNFLARSGGAALVPAGRVPVFP